MTNFRTEIAKMRLSVLSLNTPMIRSLVLLTFLVSSFAFAQALVINPGLVVADVGAGTGILSLLIA